MPKGQSADAAFLAYRSQQSYAARGPDLRRKESDDELDLISAAEGMLSMPQKPAGDVLLGQPRPTRGDQGVGKYLWVVLPADVPIAIEDNADSQGTRRRDRPQRGYLSHTNITGGAEAHSAGEMWFTSNDEIYINGASSRYQPRSPDELRAVAQGFAAMGYRVYSMGWESGIGQPARNLKEGSLECFDPAA